VVSADIVTATGDLLHVSTDEHADLFWALRGGSGNFGVVTALEFELVPVETIFGGAVFYPLTEAAPVMTAFADWVETLPEEITASVAIMRFPPLPFLPPMLRGQSVITIRACAVGDLTRAEEIVAPMRSLGTPILDTFGTMPFTAIDAISSDPIDPMPAVGATRLLRELSTDTIADLLSVAGPECDLPVLMVEIRHIAGAVDRQDRAAGSANRHDEPFALYAVGVAMGEEGRSVVLAGIDRVTTSLAAHTSPGVFLNFLGDGDCGPERTRAAYQPDDYARLGQIKAIYDPSNRFRFNCNIAPAV
ncbi:MAG: FAD-binding oxidoreductase, partial [Thermomicrobiales bacterium]